MPFCYIDRSSNTFYLAVMRQTSGSAFFRTFSDTLARAFRWQRSASTTAPAQASARRSTKPMAILSAPRPWLSQLSWEKILSFNESQCQLQNTQPTPNRESYDTARQFWDGCLGQPMSLVKALDLCKTCHDKAPFVFSNSSTFCLVARTIVEDLAKGLPPVEAHILRNTAASYIVSRVSKRELLEILRVYESKWSWLTHVSGNGHVEKPADA